MDVTDPNSRRCAPRSRFHHVHGGRAAFNPLSASQNPQSRNLRSLAAGGVKGRCFVFMSACVAVVAAAGCGPKVDQMRHFLRSHEHTVSGSEYRVCPPDVIQINSAQAPEIDGEVQVIRTDGKISLRLLGEVKVAGLTTQETANKLAVLLSRYYVRPQVSVRIVGFRSKHLYVFGQVANSGQVPYTGRDTLLDVLARAQPTFLGWTSQTRIIRPSHDDGTRHEVVVNVNEIVKKGDLERNVLLQEGDIVYVPATPLAWVGLRLREVLFPVAPVAGTIVAPAAVKGSLDVYEDEDDENDRASAASAFYP